MKKENLKDVRKINIQEPGLQDCSLGNSFLILDHAHKSARALLKAFDATRNRRKGGRKGGTTDQEQDILRAMLVFVAAGVDSMVKQLIKDALPILLGRDNAVKGELRKFVERKIANDVNPKDFKDFLTNLIIAEKLRDQLIVEYIKSLTSGSLQSADELIKSTRALGVGQDEIGLDAERLKKIFIIRNHIIHELDVHLDAPKRTRRIRKRSLMIQESNYLLEFGEKILISVEKRISKGKNAA